MLLGMLRGDTATLVSWSPQLLSKYLYSLDTELTDAQSSIPGNWQSLRPSMFLLKHFHWFSLPSLLCISLPLIVYWTTRSLLFIVLGFWHFWNFKIITLFLSLPSLINLSHSLSQIHRGSSHVYICTCMFIYAYTQICVCKYAQIYKYNLVSLFSVTCMCTASGKASWYWIIN